MATPRNPDPLDAEQLDFADIGDSSNLLRGEVTPTDSPAEPALAEYSPPPACVRSGENRGQTWERLRREGRASGMNRRESVIYAGIEIDVIRPLDDEPDGESCAKFAQKEVVTPQEVTPISPPSEGVTGLSDLPSDWPVLPANASLASEIQWVQSQRLTVTSGTGETASVSLSKASAPPPSMAAIGWLETSIRAYAKYCDIAAKATSNQEHEAEHVRRERASIEEVRGLLQEMMPDGPTCPTCGHAVDRGG